MRIIALAFFALAGCTTTASSPPTDETHAYACPGGKALSVRYDTDYTIAYVTAPSGSYKLPAKMAASGARYSDGKVEFWEKGPEAMLNGAPGGDIQDCKEAEPK